VTRFISSRNFRRIGLSWRGWPPAEQRIAAGHGAVGGKILCRSGLRRIFNHANRKRWAWVKCLQPVHDRLNPVDVGVTNIMFFAKRGRHIDMRDIVARGRIDPVQRSPGISSLYRDLSVDFANIGAIEAGEAVAKLTEIVAR